MLSDLNGGIKISIKNEDFQNDSGSAEVLKKFQADLDNLDIFTLFEERLSSCLSSISSAHREKVNNTLRVWMKNELLAWDQEVKFMLNKMK